MNMVKIYLDMDGVLADFDAYCIQTLGKHFKAFESSKAAWAEIDKHPTIYRDLAPMPDAHQLVAGVYSLADQFGCDVSILTAIPRIGVIPLCAQHKVEWLQEHFPQLAPKFNIGPYAPDKQNHARPGDVLIDDMITNIQQWNSKAGYGILHTSATSSLAYLQHHLEQTQHGTTR